MPLAQPDTIQKNVVVFERAQEAVSTLKQTVRFLTPAQKETLMIMLDPEAMGQLEESLEDQRMGRVEPIESIL